MRFIIADDSAIPRDILRRILRNAGHVVVDAVSNGNDAVAACRRHKPDVAVLDVSMPGGIQGTEAARIIKAEKLANYVVIASSANVDVVLKQFSALDIPFVPKPYNAGTFLNALDALLATKD